MNSTREPQMKPEEKSRTLLGVTRSKAKMFEYGVPDKYHIKIAQDPAKLFRLTIGILGDLSAKNHQYTQKRMNYDERQKNLFFSAHFFEAYIQSKLNVDLDPYLILLGSASYYLGDLPGSAMTLAKKQNSVENFDLGGEGLESLLLWLLQGDLSSFLKSSEGKYSEQIDSIYRGFIQFFKNGTGGKNVLENSNILRKAVYKYGTPRQLLLGDIIAAVIVKKHQNSSWYSLPHYSGLSRTHWLPSMQKDSFIKELWPAQHLLGKAGIFKGESAVVQMPTSAGKTKAAELVIRSAFLSDRTNLAVIIAPFRALCHEIRNSLFSVFENENIYVDELTDVLQTDFKLAEILGSKQILVVTPEKFLYVIRHVPELVASIGLMIFDEGHQFDSGTRGITYELLLTSLKLMLPDKAQKILFSAVISNAEAVGEWLNGTKSAIVVGKNLIPTFRSVGFASWLNPLGRIEFVSKEDAENREFYVPRVIESFGLQRKKGESLTQIRLFPNKSKTKEVGKEIALYLGLKLMSQGAIAIFCGRKDTVSGLCEIISERFSRDLPFAKPLEYSNIGEINKLNFLNEQNLGPMASATKGARLGIFSHHSNIPHGIRLAVEHSMREGLTRFVICTSTLAQGVNLPIRYLIVTGVYQGRERIKIRDFHNLIGRAGRAGMHTEGSILFSDPKVYDNRKNFNTKWRWEQVKELLEPSNSEPCTSNLLSLFEPFVSDDNKHSISMEAMDFASIYVKDPEIITNFSEEIVNSHSESKFSKAGIERQISWKLNLISSVESFLLSNWDAKEEELTESDIVRLAEKTFAYFLADDKTQKYILELFKLLAGNILQKIDDPKRRKIYGSTLFGMREAQEIEAWLQINISQLFTANTDDEILEAVWPLLIKHVHNSTFNKCNNPTVLKETVRKWIHGKPYFELLATLINGEAKLTWGKKLREFKIDHVVEICEGGLAYGGAMLIGALIELVELIDQDETTDLIIRLQSFQKKLKYGLPKDSEIVLYEIGFSDRVIAQDLSILLNESNKKTVKRFLRMNRSNVIDVLSKYPSYFQNEVFDKLS